MKKIIFLLAAFSLINFSAPAFADSCYICNGGEAYVPFSGTDDSTKRKAAEQCGCKVTGTRGDCSAANLKKLCSVANEIEAIFKLAKKK